MLLTIAQAAEQLAVSVGTVRRAMAEGRLPYRRLAPKTIRLHPDDIAEYLRRVQEENTPCRSTAAAAAGTRTSRFAANDLDALLAPARTPKSSKRRSAQLVPFRPTGSRTP